MRHHYKTHVSIELAEVAFRLTRADTVRGERGHLFVGCGLGGGGGGGSDAHSYPVMAVDTMLSYSSCVIIPDANFAANVRCSLLPSRAASMACMLARVGRGEGLLGRRRRVGGAFRSVSVHERHVVRMIGLTSISLHRT